MFGYHDNDRCEFDLWSPVEEKRVCDNTDDSVYSQFYGRDSHCAIENRAFSPYCKHQQEIMDVVDMICNGGTSFELDDDWDQSDLDELNRILRQRGIDASFSLT